jgi:Flp pilus assembly protein TadB
VFFLQGAGIAGTIAIWISFFVVALLLMLFVWIPAIRRRRRLADSLSDFLESHTKDKDIEKNR